MIYKSPFIFIERELKKDTILLENIFRLILILLLVLKY
jgi:hypothetical protein